MKRLFSKSNKYSSEWDVELNNISKTNNKRHKIITISLIVILLMLSVGVSFAVWNYGFLGETNKIETGDIEIELLESNTDIISIENALPMGDNEGKTQDKTFDFQVRTKTKNDTDIGYSLILERVQTLCGDLDNPNKDDYPECYNVIISDTDKDKLISYIVTLNIGGGKSIGYTAAPSSNLTTEQATELYNYIIAHDKEGIYNFYISMGAWEEDAQYIANMFEAEGYELYLIELYQNNTGETITPTYELKREEKVVEKNLCSDLDNPNKDDYPECYNVIISDTDKDKLISYIVTLNIGGGKSIGYTAAPSSNLTTEQATELYNYIIAHDKEGIYNFYISMGAWEEDAQYIANMFEAEGYELYLIELYQNNTGETITPTYEFDNTKTYGSIEQLKDKDIKIYLEDYQGNVLLEPTKISEISSDYVIYTKINSHDSTNENIKDKYKLRVWIDGEVDSSDWNATEKHQYKFKIGVKTKLKENEVSTEENPETSDLKYTIKYNANGGKGTMKNSIFVYNQTGKLSKNTFAREHYTFKGWSTKSTSNQVVYNDEAEVKNLTDVYHGVVNLYAVWEPEIYTVNVVVQNGTVDISSKSVTYGNDEVFAISPNNEYGAPTVSCTNSQSGTIESDNLTVKNVTEDTTCTITYKKNPTVNVVVQNGTINGETNKQVEYNKTATFNISTTGNEGYNEPTVTCTNNQSATLQNGILEIENVTSDTTCTVTYKANTYQIRYNANGGDVFPVPSMKSTSTNPWEEVSGVWRSGNYNVSSSTSTITSEEFTLTEQATLSFEWTVSSESASYDYLYYTIYKNGSTLSGTGTSTKIGGNSSITDEANLTYTTVEKELEAGTYTIEFTYRKDSSVNKGLDRGYVKNITFSDLNMSNSTFTYNIEGNLKNNKFIRTGYSFIGWSKSPDATTVDYEDGALIKNLTTENGAVIDLYAVWKINSYDVNVVVQNGTVEGETSKQVEYNKTTTFNVMANINYGRPTISCTNGQSATIENGVVTTGKITNDTTCTVTYIANPTVSVVVQNGTINGETSKIIEPNQSTTFNLTPEVSGTTATVSCTNDQTGFIEDNVLTVSNVTNDTTCSVKYITEMTTLYTDGTLIINENLANRSSNITTHGAVTNEYEAMSSSNSYVFSSNTSMPWNSEKTSVTSVEIGSEIQPVSTAYWSYGLTEMTTGDFTKLDTSSVTSMYYMFYEAGDNASTFNLTGLNNWDTSSVTNMSWLFFAAGYNATTWSIGDLSGWNTSKVEDMSAMFQNAGYSTTTWSIGDLSGWNTSSVRGMTQMFWYAGKSATTFELDLSNWDTSSVTHMGAMFDCAGESATTWSIGDLSSWNTSSVTNMSYMFAGAGYSATTFDISFIQNWDTSSVTNMSRMFNSAGGNATTFSIGDLSKWNTSSVTDMSVMFSGAGHNAKTFNIGDLSNWNTSSVTNMYAMFNEAGYSATTWTIGDLSNWNTSKVTNMSYMFQRAGYSATTFELDLSAWNTSSVTGMSSMFFEAGYKATTFNIGDLSGWNTSSVESMSTMFDSAGYSATTWSIGDLSSWDTSSVATMSGMFTSAGYSATTFNIGDLSSWDTSSVINMSHMFTRAGYSATTWSIGDLSSWDTSSVKYMSYMFRGAGYSATTFSIGNLSGWNTSSVTDMSYMFNNAGYNATWSLDCSSWNVNLVTSHTDFNTGVTSKVTPPTWVN